MNKSQKLILLVLAILNITVIGLMGMTVYRSTKETAADRVIVGVWRGTEAPFLLDFQGGKQLRVCTFSDETAILSGTYEVKDKNTIQLNAGSGDFTAQAFLTDAGALQVTNTEGEWILEKAQPASNLAQKLIGLWALTEGDRTYWIDIAKEWMIANDERVGYEIWGDVLVGEFIDRWGLWVVEIQNDQHLLLKDYREPTPASTLTRESTPPRLPQDIVGLWLGEGGLIKITPQDILIDGEMDTYEIVSDYSLWLQSRQSALTVVEQAHNSLSLMMPGSGGTVYTFYRHPLEVLGLDPASMELYGRDYDPLEFLLADPAPVSTPIFTSPLASHLLGVWRVSDGSDTHYFDFTERGVFITGDSDLPFGFYNVSDDNRLVLWSKMNLLTFQVTVLSETMLQLEGSDQAYPEEGTPTDVITMTRDYEPFSLPQDIVGTWQWEQEGLVTITPSGQFIFKDENTDTYTSTYEIVSANSIVLRSAPPSSEQFPLTFLEKSSLKLFVAAQGDLYTLYRDPIELLLNKPAISPASIVTSPLASYILGAWQTVAPDGTSHYLDFTEQGVFIANDNEATLGLYTIVDDTRLSLFVGDEETPFQLVALSENTLQLANADSTFQYQRIEACPDLGNRIRGLWTTHYEDDTLVFDFTAEQTVPYEPSESMSYTVLSDNSLLIEEEGHSLIAYVVQLSDDALRLILDSYDWTFSKAQELPDGDTYIFRLQERPLTR